MCDIISCAGSLARCQSEVQVPERTDRLGHDLLDDLPSRHSDPGTTMVTLLANV